jgi:putative nucleotidyltransferase with HDIG domain
MSEKALEKIRQEVEEIGALPTLPEIPMKILHLIATDESSSMEDIAKIVERDPALTANILKVANSAYYGVRQKIASLKLSLAILGLNEIINIVTSISIVRLFPAGRGNGNFDRAKFWQHSFGCAAAVRMLAKDLDLDTQGVGFVAGLLHDLGKLILDQYFHSKLREVQKLKTKEGISNLEAEVRSVGVDHATIGSWLAQRWDLPASLVESIAYHHRPLDVLALAPPSREPVLTAMVHLADILAHEPDLDFTESLQSSESFGDNLAWKIILAERPELSIDSIDLFIANYEDYKKQVSALVQAVA